VNDAKRVIAWPWAPQERQRQLSLKSCVVRGLSRAPPFMTSHRVTLPEASTARDGTDFHTQGDQVQLPVRRRISCQRSLSTEGSHESLNPYMVAAVATSERLSWQTVWCNCDRCAAAHLEAFCTYGTKFLAYRVVIKDAIRRRLTRTVRGGEEYIATRCLYALTSSTQCQPLFILGICIRRAVIPIETRSSSRELKFLTWEKNFSKINIPILEIWTRDGLQIYDGNLAYLATRMGQQYLILQHKLCHEKHTVSVQ